MQDMHYSNRLARLIFQFMRVRLLPVALIVCLTGVAYAGSVNGQEVLRKKISLSADQEQMKSILHQISKSAEVKFIYISPKIPDRKKITLVAYNEELGNVLARLFTPFAIQYEVMDDQIILKANPQFLAANADGTFEDQETSSTAEVKDPPLTGKVLDD